MHGNLGMCLCIVLIVINSRLREHAEVRSMRWLHLHRSAIASMVKQNEPKIVLNHE
jgi:hypothetical protein